MSGEGRRSDRLPRFEIVKHPQNSVDVGVPVVEIVEGAGEPHRIARIVTLVELLTARKG